MKILFLVKFYQPFDRGGSEWSTRDLAISLSKNGHEVTILTPNYGSKDFEIIEKINVSRFPFPIKLKDPKQKISPFWTSNVFWYLYSFLICLYFSQKGKYQIIHAHNNEFIPAAALVGLVTNVPTVVTFRDYQALCCLGFCFWNGNKACSLTKFVTYDYIFFFKNYVKNKNPISLFIYLLAALRAMIAQQVVKFFAKRINKKIAVSKKVRDIFKDNGIEGLEVINNPVLVTDKPQKGGNTIVYVGKFSSGKGINLLLEIIPKILKTLPKSNFVLIGSGDIEEEIKYTIKKNKLGKKVKITGQLQHREVFNYLKNAGLVVVPSLWPEPLPRSVIEAMLSAVPVVATNVGGIGEILESDQYGIVTSANKDDLYRGIVKAFRNRQVIKARITKDLDKLRKHFSIDSVDSYLKIYKTLAK